MVAITFSPAPAAASPRPRFASMHRRSSASSRRRNSLHSTAVCAGARTRRMPSTSTSEASCSTLSSPPNRSSEMGDTHVTSRIHARLVCTFSWNATNGNLRRPSAAAACNALEGCTATSPFSSLYVVLRRTLPPFTSTVVAAATFGYSPATSTAFTISGVEAWAFHGARMSSALAWSPLESTSPASRSSVKNCPRRSVIMPKAGSLSQWRRQTWRAALAPAVRLVCR
mmetsp:Transcript_14400/g.60098  ORF Transcript_14400/g.60098 Transcript_14400/m.60098 type:complete len:227 (+) Transcript_14400:139-819(+)